jgi:hypothetical protein
LGLRWRGGGTRNPRPCWCVASQRGPPTATMSLPTISNRYNEPIQPPPPATMRERKKETERMIAPQDGHVEYILLETSGTRTGGKSSRGARNRHSNSIIGRDLRCKDAPRGYCPAKRLPQSCIPP